MDRKTNAFWAALTILIVLAALVLCFIGQNRGFCFPARPAIHKAPSQAFLTPSKPANMTPPAVIWKTILLSGWNVHPTLRRGRLCFPR